MYSKRNPSYNIEADKKCFLSIDLKEANFQTISHIMRHIVKSEDFPENWKECLEKFTSCSFLPLCKELRQIWIGESKWNKTWPQFMQNYFVFPALKNLNELGINKPLGILKDELIWQNEEKDTKLHEQLSKFCLDQKLKNNIHWKLDSYQIHVLSKKYSYFVKISSGTRRFKNVQKIHISQAIKQDLGQKIEPLDLYFISTTKELAQFVKPTEF
jgi:hypothetical protein